MGGMCRGFLSSSLFSQIEEEKFAFGVERLLVLGRVEQMGRWVVSRNECGVEHYI